MSVGIELMFWFEQNVCVSSVSVSFEEVPVQHSVNGGNRTSNYCSGPSLLTFVLSLLVLKPMSISTIYLLIKKFRN